MTHHRESDLSFFVSEIGFDTVVNLCIASRVLEEKRERKEKYILEKRERKEKYIIERCLMQRQRQETQMEDGNVQQTLLPKASTMADNKT